MTDTEIREAANLYARANRRRIAKELTSLDILPADSHPITILMAGSPGAGKTEFSKGLLNQLDSRHVLRIDADDLRRYFPDYNGSNSHLFQAAVVGILERVIDEALHNSQTFILDGTMTNYEKAVRNIERSLKRNRKVEIYYVYQEPKIAWNFTQKREQIEGRRILKDNFIQQFINSRRNVTQIRSEYGSEVEIHLVKKDFKQNVVESVTEILNIGPSIDDIIGKEYTQAELEKII